MGIEICGPSGEAVNNRPMFINDGGSNVRPAGGKQSGNIISDALSFFVGAKGVVSSPPIEESAVNNRLQKVTTGTQMESVFFETSDFSVLQFYYNTQIDDLASSYGGMTINMGHSSIDAHFGVQDIGVYGQFDLFGTTQSVGGYINIQEGRLGYTTASSREKDGVTTTVYQDTSMSIGWALAIVLIGAVGGSSFSTPSYAPGY